MGFSTSAPACCRGRGVPPQAARTARNTADFWPNWSFNRRDAAPGGARRKATTRKGTSMKKLIALGLALGTGLAMAGTAQAQVKFGVTGPFTGPNAAFGAQIKNGVDQAIEDVNATGGI